jgi:hypothetical protein
VKTPRGSTSGVRRRGIICNRHCVARVSVGTPSSLAELFVICQLRAWVSRRSPSSSRADRGRRWRPPLRARGQVHVTHRGGQAGVAGQFLDDLRRHALHRKVRAERVAQDVDRAFVHGQPCVTMDALHRAAERSLVDGAAVTLEIKRDRRAAVGWSSAPCSAASVIGTTGNALGLGVRRQSGITSSMMHGPRSAERFARVYALIRGE